jgi:hypothetical protein
MAKQTPIEWMLTHMIAEGYLDEKEILNKDTYLNELCKTAFEIEKNALIMAYDADLYGSLSGKRKYQNGLHFFNDTYTKNETKQNDTNNID